MADVENGADAGAKVEDQGGAGKGAEEVDYKAKYEEALGHSRTWESRAKANKEAADELKQLKDAQKSEAERTADRIKQLEAENAKYKQRDQVAGWAKEIVGDSEIPASVLRGSTRDELQEHFEQLQSALPARRRKSPAPKGTETQSGAEKLKAHEALKLLKKN